MTRVLAVDVGTSAVKVALVDDGDVVAAAEESYLLSSPHPGWAEQDPEDWWAATRRAAAAVAGSVGCGPGSIGVDAVAVTGQMQDLVCVDASGAPSRPAILYSDVRATVEHAALVSDLGPAWDTAIGAAPDPSHVAAKWRWLTTHEPDVAERTRRVLFGAAGFVVMRLTGVAACDPSTAATTGLYDVDAGRWWPPVVERLGVPLPSLVAATDVAGEVSAAGAAALGVAVGTPVVHANGDAAATTIGVCGLALERPYAYLGSSGWVAASTAVPRRTAGVIVLPGLGPDSWMAAAQMSVAGAALDWAREQLLGGAAIADLEAMAASTCAAAEGVLFVPYLDGARGVPEATGMLVGARRATTTATIAAAVVEGLAHAVRDLLGQVAPGSDELVVCGGASRSPALRQAIADVTGCLVTPVAVEHAAVLGAVTAAHVALGVDTVTIQPVGAPTAPDTVRRSIHDHIASIFDALVPTMSPLLTSLAESSRARGEPIV
jgi:xylulokinase